VWLTSTKVTAAAAATATLEVDAEAPIPIPLCSTAARTDHAASPLSTTFAMLKPSMNHG